MSVHQHQRTNPQWLHLHEAPSTAKLKDKEKRKQWSLSREGQNVDQCPSEGNLEEDRVTPANLNVLHLMAKAAMSILSHFKATANV